MSVSWQLQYKTTLIIMMRNTHRLWGDLNTCLTAKILMFVKFFWGQVTSSYIGWIRDKNGKWHNLGLAHFKIKIKCQVPMYFCIFVFIFIYYRSSNTKYLSHNLVTTSKFKIIIYFNTERGVFSQPPLWSCFSVFLKLNATDLINNRVWRLSSELVWGSWCIPPT